MPSLKRSCSWCGYSWPAFVGCKCPRCGYGFRQMTPALALVAHNTPETRA